MDMGDSESTAEEKALLQMGDPVAVGAALDSTHKPAPQWTMMGLVMVLFLLGAVIQFLFLKNVLANTDFQGVSMNTLIIFLPISLAVFFMAYFLDFSFFGKHPYILPISIILIDTLTQFFGIWYGGGRWLHFGPFSLSPASVTLLFPLAFCSILYKLREKGIKGYWLSGIIAACFCAVLLIWHPTGGIVVFICSAGFLMLVAAYKKWFSNGAKTIFALLVIMAVVCVFVLSFTAQFRYRLAGMTAILHPEIDPTGAGYLSDILQNMIKNSALIGEGASFLNYDVTYAIMPSDFRSDFLLSYLTYKCGWVTSLTLVTLLAIFLTFGFRKCMKQKSILGQMVSFSILCTFTAEILLYVVANLGYPLIAPIALPFLSYGGTALVIHMALAGILLSVFRTGEVYQDSTKPLLNESKFIQWDDGKLIISFK